MLTHDQELEATQFIDQGRANSKQSALRLSEIIKLEKQNDELLGALRAIADYNLSGEQSNQVRQFVRDARAAIAQAEGK